MRKFYFGLIIAALFGMASCEKDTGGRIDENGVKKTIPGTGTHASGGMDPTSPATHHSNGEASGGMDPANPRNKQ